MEDNFENLLGRLLDKYRLEISSYQNRLDDMTKSHQEELEKYKEKSKQHIQSAVKMKSMIMLKSEENKKLRQLLQQHNITVPSVSELIEIKNSSNTTTILKESPDTSSASPHTSLTTSPSPSQNRRSLRLGKPKKRIIYHEKPHPLDKPHPLIKDSEGKKMTEKEFINNVSASDNRVSPEIMETCDNDETCYVQSSQMGVASQEEEELSDSDNTTCPPTPIDNDSVALFTSRYYHDDNKEKEEEEREEMYFCNSRSSSPSLIKEIIIDGGNMSHDLSQRSDDLSQKLQDFNRSHDVSHDLPQRSHDVSHDLPQKSRDVSHDLPQRSHDVSHDLPQRSHDVSHDLPHRSHDVSHDLPHRSHDVSHDLPQRSHDVSYNKRKHENISKNTKRVRQATMTQLITADNQRPHPHPHNIKNHIVPPTPFISHASLIGDWSDDVIVTSISKQSNDNTVKDVISSPDMTNHHGNDMENHHGNNITNHHKNVSSTTKNYRTASKPLSKEQELALKAGLPTYKCTVSLRKKEDRQKLKATACAECTRWYKADNGLYDNVADHIQKTCRHRHLYPPPESDPTIWDISFPD